MEWNVRSIPDVPFRFGE